MTASTRLAARLCWTLHDRPWVLLSLDAVGALLFVLGCVAFYSPAQYVAGVTLFLVGSMVMLVSVLGRALARYGPS